MNLWSLTHEKVEEIKKQFKIKEEELKELRKITVEMFWDADLDKLAAMLDELDLQDDKDQEAAREATEGRRRKVGGMRGRAAAAPVVRKRVVEGAERKALSAPLVANATGSLGDVQKSVSGVGEGGPTRYSASDIPMEDQDAVNRDPDIIQRPAKAPRVKRAATGTVGEEAAKVPDSPPAAEEGGGGGAGLLARLLAGRKSAPVASSSGSHSAMSTGADFFFGSSSSIFSSGLPEPDADLSGGGTEAAGDAEPPGKKAKKAGKKKKEDVDDDDEEA